MKFRRPLKFALGFIVVILLLATFLPERKPRGISYVNACKSNLREIQKAKEQWAVDHKKVPTDVPSDTDLFGSDAYIRNQPIYPSNGSYRINAVGALPTCSLAFQGHSLSPDAIRSTNNARGIANPP